MVIRGLLCSVVLWVVARGLLHSLVASVVDGCQRVAM